MLKNTIESLTKQFTAQILHTLRTTPLDQLMQTHTDIPNGDPVQALLAQHPKGLRAEDIRTQIGLTPAQTTKALKRLLAEGSITKRGERRSTVYKVKR